MSESYLAGWARGVQTVEESKRMWEGDLVPVQRIVTNELNWYNKLPPEMAANPDVWSDGYRAALHSCWG